MRPNHAFQKAFYDDKYVAERHWTRFQQLKRELRLRWLRPYIRASDRVIDIGCGRGYVTYCLSSWASYALGVDISEAGVARAKEQYGSRSCAFLCVDILRFRPDEMFDVAVLMEIVEHFEDASAVLVRLRECLRPGSGRLLITTPRGDRITNRIRVLAGLEPRRDIYHVREYSPREMHDLLRQCGFDCKVTKHAGLDVPLPTRWRMTRRLRKLLRENRGAWYCGRILSVLADCSFYVAVRT